MSSIPTNPDALLMRGQTSEALKESGFPIEPSTLATKATRGGGPLFQKFGARVLYRWGDALAWAQSRLSAPRRNTSEGDAIGQAARAESELPRVERVTMPPSRPAPLGRERSRSMRRRASSNTEPKPVA
jgi:hypothetical protein